MKTSYITALLIAVALNGLACRKASQQSGNSNVAAAPTASDNRAGASQSNPPVPPRTHLKVGDTAPDFTLNDTNGTAVRLSDFRGKKNVALAFYVLAFTGG